MNRYSRNLPYPDPQKEIHIEEDAIDSNHVPLNYDNPEIEEEISNYKLERAKIFERLRKKGN